MKVAYYCQHVLGIGHLHRSLEICRAMAVDHSVTMILGGSPIQIEKGQIDIFQLPGLMMNEEFQNLAPVDPGRSLSEVQSEREKILFHFIETFQPDVFMIELYPFGRKAFRNELDPVLKALRKGRLRPSLTVCSLRDILVERTDSTKFEKRVISTLNDFFDLILVHGDRRLCSIDETFSRVSDIHPDVIYTGYVSPDAGQQSKTTFRKNRGIEDGHKYVVGSIGGGSVGSELLASIVDAVKFLNDKKIHLDIFTGPYCSDEQYTILRQKSGNNINIQRFTSDFIDHLNAADLSVSMAGYNTTMNCLATGTPALFYPFMQNNEQFTRISKLEKLVPFQMISKEQLSIKPLAELIATQLAQNKFTSPININGASNSVKIVEEWHSKGTYNEL